LELFAGKFAPFSNGDIEFDIHDPDPLKFRYTVVEVFTHSTYLAV